jgi:hypothetical protein
MEGPSSHIAQHSKMSSEEKRFGSDDKLLKKRIYGSEYTIQTGRLRGQTLFFLAAARQFETDGG